MEAKIGMSRCEGQALQPPHHKGYDFVSMSKGKQVIEDGDGYGVRRHEWNASDWEWDSRLFTAMSVHSNSVEIHKTTSNVVGNIIANSASEKRRKVLMGEEEDMAECLTLKLGGNDYCSSSMAVNDTSRSGKRPRAMPAPTPQSTPKCQVDDCKVDLNTAKDYHRRHKVCEMHAKANKALVGRLMQRFCQQCSRFHLLEEFDEGKRSCRRRLAGHNRRRRKSHPDAIFAGACLNDEHSSASLIMTLLRVLSQLQTSNNSEQTSNQDLVVQLLKKLANSTDIHNGTNAEATKQPTVNQSGNLLNCNTTSENGNPYDSVKPHAIRSSLLNSPTITSSSRLGVVDHHPSVFQLDKVSTIRGSEQPFASTHVPYNVFLQQKSSHLTTKSAVPQYSNTSREIWSSLQHAWIQSNAQEGTDVSNVIDLNSVEDTSEELLPPLNGPSTLMLLGGIDSRSDQTAFYHSGAVSDVHPTNQLQISDNAESGSDQSPSSSQSSGQAFEIEQVCAGSRENCSSTNTTNAGHCQGLRDVDNLMKNDQSEPIQQFYVPQQFQSSSFRLMHVQGLPTWANTGSVTIGDVIKGDVLVAILSNYMVDMDWLLSASPILRTIPHVLVIHGESGGTLEYLKKKKPSNWLLYKPPLRLSYGTHHSKAMLLVYRTGVRVVVHTANLIYVDWNNKTQGLWMQDFPLKEEKDVRTTSPFENDLVEYLEALEWAGFSAPLPQTGDVMMNAAYFRRFDYSAAAVRLVASVPGYHQGSRMKKWGHMKIRTILQEQCFEKEFQGSPLVYQFSSLGSLDEKWMAEFNSSMFSGHTFEKQPLGSGSIQIIWPSVEDVRRSLEGYAAGNAIPSPYKNVVKEFLKRYWAKWEANHTGRCHAMPHIKTYSRYNGQSLAWFLLTSSNLSKAAWGVLQKNSSQLMIRSYELGVIFLPSLVLNSAVKFSCTDNYDHNQVKCNISANEDVNASYPAKLVTLCWEGRKSEQSPPHVVTLPVPYKLPPKLYTSEDVPWSWDREYSKPDVYGEVWPRSVKLYVNQ